MEQITVDKPVTLNVIPEDLNAILAGLDMLPHGKVRATYARLEAQIVAQARKSPEVPNGQSTDSGTPS
jgi:hypothetical protein